MTFQFTLNRATPVRAALSFEKRKKRFIGKSTRKEIGSNSNCLPDRGLGGGGSVRENSLARGGLAGQVSIGGFQHRIVLDNRPLDSERTQMIKFRSSLSFLVPGGWR